MENSKIEWTHHTFNPWIGCTKVSAGCDHCYAETRDQRWAGGVHWGAGAPRQVTSDANWRQPLKWNREALIAGERRRVFCASLADWADAEAPEGQRARLWDTIRVTTGLDWLLLTKRHGRIARCLPPDWGQGWPHVWLGVSVENQEAADTRIPVLLSIPAAVRFLSCEPLLGPVDLKHIAERTTTLNAIYGERTAHTTGCVVEDELPTVDWVIVGGESGPGARPMHPQWARQLRDQCKEAAAGVAFHFKQWGEYVPEGECPHFNPASALTLYLDGTTHPAAHGPYPGGHRTMHRVGKHKAGRMLDGRTWDEYPHAQLVGAAP